MPQTGQPFHLVRFKRDLGNITGSSKLKPINLILVLLSGLTVADVMSPSLALSIPICFLVISVVVMFYFDLDDYRKLKAIDKRVDELESSLRSLKSSMNLKNI